MPSKPLPPPLPYKSKNYFLSKLELSFYRALKEVMGPNITVCPNVKLSDLLQDPPSLHYLGMINQKHVDFLLCNSTTMQILAAVELNDSTHNRKDRRQRDQLVCDVLEAARIPLFVFPVQENYTTQDILKHLSANKLPFASSKT